MIPSTREALASYAEHALTMAKTRTQMENDRHHVRADWGRAEVLRQMLWHNAYYDKRVAQGRRSDGNTEEAAIRWAATGVVTVQHVLNSQGDDVCSVEEFKQRWPDLEADAYEDIVQALPVEWRQTLRQGESAAARAREFSHGTSRFMRVCRPTAYPGCPGRGGNFWP